MPTLRSGSFHPESEIAMVQRLEEIKAFEHAKLVSRPFKHLRWRPKKDITYKYDPNKSDTVIIYQDMTKWRQ